eukprot:2767240-Prymnesium_polylepis.2
MPAAASGVRRGRLWQDARAQDEVRRLQGEDGGRDRRQREAAHVSRAARVCGGGSAASATSGRRAGVRSGDKSAVAKLEESLLVGCDKYAKDGRAGPGTEFCFAIRGASMGVSVNGKSVATISSKPLCKALLNCYLDGARAARTQRLVPAGCDTRVACPAAVAAWVRSSRRLRATTRAPPREHRTRAASARARRLFGLARAQVDVRRGPHWLAVS